MDINQETRGAVTIVAPQGRVDSNTAKAFEERILGILDGGAKSVVIDLGGLAYISSAGLRVLLMAAKRAKSQQVKLALCALTDNVRSVFDMSGFGQLFQIHKAVEEAIASVQ